MNAAVPSAPFDIFIHIPKAAGTTLRSIVDAQYGRKRVLTYYNQTSTALLNNLGAVIDHEPDRYNALIGHFPYGSHSTVKRPCRYATIMRDPVERTISAYYEIAATDPGRLTNPDGSSAGLYDSLNGKPADFQNQQSLMLLGAKHVDDLSPNDAVHYAKKILDRFAFVGTAELFDASILLMSKLLGWSPCCFGRLNPTTKSRNIDHRTRDFVKELNDVDIAIYGQVRNRLAEQIAAAGEILQQALEELSRFETPGNQDPASLIESGSTKIDNYLRS